MVINDDSSSSTIVDGHQQATNFVLNSDDKYQNFYKNKKHTYRNKTIDSIERTLNCLSVFSRLTVVNISQCVQIALTLLELYCLPFHANR